MATTASRTLPFPLPNMPGPDDSVSRIDVQDRVIPALRGVASILEDLSLTAARRGDEGHAAALLVLAERIETCLGLIDRATSDR